MRVDSAVFSHRIHIDSHRSHFIFVPQTHVAFEDHSSFAAAHEKRLAEIKAVDNESLALNVDVHSAVTSLVSLRELGAAQRASLAI